LPCSLGNSACNRLVAKPTHPPCSGSLTRAGSIQLSSLMRGESHEDDHVRPGCAVAHRRGCRRGPSPRCQDLLWAGRPQSQL